MQQEVIKEKWQSQKKRPPRQVLVRAMDRGVPHGLSVVAHFPLVAQFFSTAICIFIRFRPYLALISTVKASFAASLDPILIIYTHIIHLDWD